MSSSLGSFGKKKKARDDTFDYFGVTIRVHPQLSDAALFDFMRRSKGLNIQVDPEDVEGMRAAFEVAQPLVEDFMTSEIHPEDVDLFYRTARDNGQDMIDIAQVLRDVMSAVANRPTGRPSDSSRGRPTTKRSSAAKSSSRVKRRLEQQGRPDLALMVLEADEARAAKRSA